VYDDLENPKSIVNIIEVDPITLTKEVDVEKSWHEDIEQLCVQHNITFYMWKDVKDKLNEIIEKNAKEKICCLWCIY
jgi:hypothetical protein